jgi:hypothetical protein
MTRRAADSSPGASARAAAISTAAAHDFLARIFPHIPRIPLRRDGSTVEKLPIRKATP